MFLKSEHLTASHGFFTRQGGVSQPPFDSLNCGYGSGEAPELVTQNRDIVLKAVGGNVLVTAEQTHSDIAIVVSGMGDFKADALVTRTPGVALGILTADCTPILFQDKKAGIIGAAHAGWRGARFGIIGSTIRAMQNMGADDITAVIGPTIQHNSYEVSADFVSVFAMESHNNSNYFTRSKNEGHFMFDLPGYVEEKLRKNGVKDIHNLAEDTLTQPEKFYSYRRGTLEGAKEYGRQISVISL